MKPISPELKQFIKKHVAGLRETAFLNHFKIDVEIAKLKDASMTIDVDYRYLDAQIIIDRDTLITDWESGRKLKIMEALSHEICHCITQEMSAPFHTKYKLDKFMSEQAQHFEERVTEHFSRLVLQLYFYENKLDQNRL